MTDSTGDTEKTMPLTWHVNRGGVTIHTPGSKPGMVCILLPDGEEASLPAEVARDLFTHAFAHLGGVSDRSDAGVCEVALMLCEHHARMRDKANKRLDDLQERFALQARHLGECMGRLKKYE